MCVAMVVVVIALSAVEATAEGAEVAELMDAELQKWVYVPDEQTSGECHTLTPLSHLDFVPAPGTAATAWQYVMSAGRGWREGKLLGR